MSTRRWMPAWAGALLLAAAFGAQAAVAEAEAWLARGIAQRQAGSIQRSIDSFEAAIDAASDDARQQARIEGELGISLLQAGRYDQADELLQRAHQGSTGAARARFALYRGQMALARKDPSLAASFFDEAEGLAGGDAALQAGALLGQARLAEGAERLASLQAAAKRLDAAPAGPGAAPLIGLRILLGDQARQLGVGSAEGVALAYRQLSAAREQARAAGEGRLETEALDALAQLYEDQRRGADALALTAQGLARLRTLEAGAAADLAIALQWRQARLLAAGGPSRPAREAYDSLVTHIESVRQDIPIEYADGRSSFRETLEPIYLGYADLLLKSADGLAPREAEPTLRRVRDVVELIRQTELQDYMGDRCAVEAVGGGSLGQLAPGTAVVYPIVLPDRLELLVETPAGLERHRVAVTREALGRAATALAERLRDPQDDFLPGAQQLHQWLLAPLRETFAAQQVHSIVMVPDGALRLVPLGVLHDGRQFVIEQYAVAMVTGLSMTNSAAPARGRVDALVAGLSVPGPVVEQLGQHVALLPPAPVAQRGLASAPRTRALRSATAGALAGETAEALRARLSLPGVEDEVQALRGILSGRVLLNQDFTVGNFQDEAQAGDYRVVHIASHGVFGGTAESSFIMAYDSLLGMNSLQALLQSERYRKHPIELLSLSACETAEGNDRAPLGMAGAAIRARAKSVLGTLWPVDDAAARNVMERLYAGVSRDQLGKSEALRRAQLALLHEAGSAHPFYWAPFVIVGNWL